MHSLLLPDVTMTMEGSRLKKDAPSTNKGGVVPEISKKMCPIARNGALLDELDIAEGKVAELLEVAAGALDELAGVESLDNAKVEESTKHFLALVSSVHESLLSKASLIRDYTPYPRSIYGPRRELELLHEKARFLRSELASMSRDAPVVPPAAAAADPAETLTAAGGLLKDTKVASELPKDSGTASAAGGGSGADSASAAATV